MPWFGVSAYTTSKPSKIYPLEAGTPGGEETKFPAPGPMPGIEPRGPGPRAENRPDSYPTPDMAARFGLAVTAPFLPRDVKTIPKPVPGRTIDGSEDPGGPHPVTSHIRHKTAD